MVDRYRSLGARMLQEPHGAYVTHENYQRLEAKRQRLIDIAGEALGFSEYQRDQDTVEVLANYSKRLAEELAECKAKTTKKDDSMEEKELAEYNANRERFFYQMKSL